MPIKIAFSNEIYGIFKVISVAVVYGQRLQEISSTFQDYFGFTFGGKGFVVSLLYMCV